MNGATLIITVPDTALTNAVRLHLG